MAKLPEHEERMIDFIDWNLCCDLNIWIERKSGRTEPVIALYNELLKCCTLYTEEVRGTPSHESFLAEPGQLAKDLIIYLNMKYIGNVYEVSAVKKHFRRDYNKHSSQLIKLTESKDVQILINEISDEVKMTWSAIIERQGSSMDGFSIYFNWLRKNYIKDATFSPKTKPKLFDDEMWAWWIKYRNDNSVLDEPIPSKQKEIIVKQWNVTSKRNYGLSGMIEGFLFDTDYTNIQLDDQYGHDAYVIYIPKEVGEERFDSLILDIKSCIFERTKPIETVRNYLTWYLPTSLRNGVYKRQLISQKNQVIAYYAALLCDVFYVEKDKLNAKEIAPVKVTSFMTAAEVACLYLSDYGFEYSPDTIIKVHRKLFNETMPTFVMDFY